MSENSPVLDKLARKLGSRARLSAADLAALMSLPCRQRTVSSSGYLVREGDQPQYCVLLESGFAYRQRLTIEGARQIIAIQIPGDIVDLQNLFMRVSDHNVQALTRATVSEIPVLAMRDVARAHPAIMEAILVDTLIEAAAFREWVVNVGRRDARTRLAHLLCELAVRLRAAGVSDSLSYDLPMTQEQLGDALGLTSVHVNRVLRILVREGIVALAKRHVSITDWEALRTIADFNERYLHLDQTAAIV